MNVCVCVCAVGVRSKHAVSRHDNGQAATVLYRSQC